MTKIDDIRATTRSWLQVHSTTTDEASHGDSTHDDKEGIHAVGLATGKAFFLQPANVSFPEPYIERQAYSLHLMASSRAYLDAMLARLARPDYFNVFGLVSHTFTGADATPWSTVAGAPAPADGIGGKDDVLALANGDIARFAFTSWYRPQTGTFTGYIRTTDASKADALTFILGGGASYTSIAVVMISSGKLKYYDGGTLTNYGNAVNDTWYLLTIVPDLRAGTWSLTIDAGSTVTPAVSTNVHQNYLSAMGITNGEAGVTSYLATPAFTCVRTNTPTNPRFTSGSLWSASGLYHCRGILEVDWAA